VVKVQANVSKQEPALQVLRHGAGRGVHEESIASPILLHGAFAAERLMLWGETRAASSASAPPSRRREAPALGHAALDQDRFAFSPYDAREALVAAIAASGIPRWGRRTESAVILLPSLGDRPRASSPLVAEPLANSDPRPATSANPNRLAKPAVHRLTLRPTRKCFGPGVRFPTIAMDK